MSSAFVRRQPPRAADLGTRPGLHGQVLVSSGVAGLDALLGGGLPLGCVLVVLEDGHSQQHLNLLKCFMAEGLCCRHSVAWVTAQQLDARAAAAFLPDQARSSAAAGAAGSSGVQGPSSSSAATTAGSPGAAPPAAAAAAGQAAASQAEDGLKIAWQYRKYIQAQQRAGASGLGAPQAQTDSSKASSSSSSSSSSAAKAVAAGIGRQWCHQFDLSRGLTPEQLKAQRLELHCCGPSAEQPPQGRSAVQAAIDASAGFLARFQPAGPIPVPSRDPASIGRLVVQSLGSHDWWPASSDGCSSSDDGGSEWQALEAAMLAAVAGVRLAVQDATCAALITCPAALFSESFQAQLQHLGDAVLCIQSLADNTDVYRLLPDPTSASALLEVRRLPHLGLLRQRHIEERLYVVRSKRRGISIGVLDLLPLEAVEEGGGGDRSAQTAGSKPAAAQICGSGPGKPGLVDF